MSDRTVDPLADQRVKRRAQGQREVLAEPEVGQTEARHDVQRPRVQTPVEVRDPQGVHRAGLVHRQRAHLVRMGVRRVRLGLGVVEVPHRLGDGEEQQADAKAGGEEHRQPGEGSELGARVVGAEPDPAVPAHHEVHARDQHDAEDGHVVAAERHVDPAPHRGVDRAGALDVHHGEADERQHQGHRRQRHPAVHAASPAA